LAIGLFAADSLTLPGFTDPGNLLSILRSIAILGVLSLGMAVVVIGRGIDLSMVAVMAMATAWQLDLINQGLPSLASALFVGGVVVLVGLLNGLLIAYADVPAIFATLATGSFFFGMVRSQIISQDVIYLPPSAAVLNDLGQVRVLGLPIEVLLFIATGLIAFAVLRYSKFGRFVYCLGDNYQAARTMGIPVRLVILAQYVASALFAWAAGAVTMVGLHSINTRIYNSTLLYDVILVVVIGGIGLSGGKGGVRNVVVGALLIGILLNGMTILDLPNIYQNLIKALILLLALIVDARLNPRDEQTGQQGDI
jgi:ribose transport system permease protein